MTEQVTERPVRAFPTYESYKIELRNGHLHDLKTVRSTQATDIDGAIGFIEGYRSTAESTYSVVWEGPDPDVNGVLRGLAPNGVVWEIVCVPPLSFDLG